MIKQYPIEAPKLKLAKADTLEVKQMQTILGHHVLLKDSEGWHHFLQQQLVKQSELSENQVRLLINDAIASNRDRYGDIVSVDGTKAMTSTGVEVTVNWSCIIAKAIRSGY